MSNAMARSSPWRRYFRRGLIVCVLILVGVGVAVGVRALDQPEEAPSNTNETPAVPVEATDVTTMTLRETVRGIGTLQAFRVVHLSPEVEGMLREVNFREGSMVEEGQVLLRIDDRKIQRRLAAREAALRAARARLDIAQTTFDRVKRLREQDVVSSDEFDRARTDLDAAVADIEELEAEVELVREELKDTRIMAPFTGMISERLVDAGNYVQIADRLATLYQTDPIEMRFRLPERHAGRVRIGQPVEVLVAASPDERFVGDIQFVSPSVDEQTREFLVKAVIDNEDGRLRPGSFGTAVVILAEHENRPVVPEEAIVATREGPIVFRIEDGRVQRQPVRTGLRQEGMIEIVDGLEPGQLIVRLGQLRISDGARVRTKSDADANGSATPEPAGTHTGQGTP